MPLLRKEVSSLHWGTVIMLGKEVNTKKSFYFFFFFFFRFLFLGLREADESSNGDRQAGRARAVRQ
ncbi:hypothetical protein HMPREF9413_2615 [Paenibacillus sp. HGF7]|nr:hypothetical protein HMPREF9413_2615 [Paenibacillus sp. HGF7]